MARAWILASALSVGAIACGSPGAEETAAPAPVRPPALPKGQVETVAEAITALEGTLQDAYLAGAVTPREGDRLLGLADLARDANDADDFVRAFGYIEQAHAEIEQNRVSGEPSSDEAAVRLHQAFDLLGAMIATHPPDRA